MSTESKTAFLIMPFDRDLDWLHAAIAGAGVDEGLTVERADSIFSPGAILGQILQKIDEADVIIAVCTGKNANVFFELGYAWQRHSPILVAESSSDLPFDVAAFRTLMYGGASGDTSKATVQFRLRQAIRAALQDSGLPKGRVLSSRAVAGNRPAATGRTTSNGKNVAFVVTNSGNVPLYNVNIVIPEDVHSLFLHRDDLPVAELRPGDGFSISTTGMMGGGPRIFDATITAKDPDGSAVRSQFKVSL